MPARLRAQRVLGEQQAVGGDQGTRHRCARSRIDGVDAGSQDRHRAAAGGHATPVSLRVDAARKPRHYGRAPPCRLESHLERRASPRPRRATGADDRQVIGGREKLRVMATVVQKERRIVDRRQQRRIPPAAVQHAASAKLRQARSLPRRSLHEPARLLRDGAQAACRHLPHHAGSESRDGIHVRGAIEQAQLLHRVQAADAIDRQGGDEKIAGRFPTASIGLRNPFPFLQPRLRPPTIQTAVRPRCFRFRRSRADGDGGARHANRWRPGGCRSGWL